MVSVGERWRTEPDATGGGDEESGESEGGGDGEAIAEEFGD